MDSLYNTSAVSVYLELNLVEHPHMRAVRAMSELFMGLVVKTELGADTHLITTSQHYCTVIVPLLEGTYF